MEKKLVVRISEELHQQAKEKCKREDITLSQVIRRALREWVEDPPEEENEDL